mmetsp:Transcript_112490/g.318948  ORF Transcript_112490/g.318948 Transcript_112490/m.318948 type:complete len:417 (+) Transcript_112490:135-1385(+)
MALTHAEPRLAPLDDFQAEGALLRTQKRRQTYSGYTPFHLGLLNDDPEPELEAERGNASGTPSPRAAGAACPGAEAESQTSAPGSQDSEASSSPRESTVELYPDTDSEFGDYSAFRATWRKTEEGGAAHAPDESREPQQSARAEQPARVQTRRCRGRKARVTQAMMSKVTPGKDDETITTVMLRNVPSHCKTDMLIHALDTTGFLNTYDFCYMPCDFGTSASKGYAFVNFKSPTITRCFRKLWHGTHRFPGHADGRALQVTAAHIQGYEANIAMAEQTVGIRNPNFRRLVFTKPDSPAASPVCGAPPAPPRCGSTAAEGTAPRPLPRPPGLFSACAGARPQASADEPSVQHQVAPSGWPAACGRVYLCQPDVCALHETFAPGRQHKTPQLQLAAKMLTAQPGSHALTGLVTGQQPR